MELRATLQFEEKISGWANMSSTIRGIWGRTLKKTYCLQRNVACEECGMNNCSYYNVFKKKYGDFENYHPYIIYPDSIGGKRATIVFKFFGWVCNHYDKLLISIMKLSEMPVIIKGRRCFFVIEKITDYKKRIIYALNDTKVIKPDIEDIIYTPQDKDRAKIDILTPFRQKHKGHLISDFRPSVFAFSVYKRLKFFNKHFCENAINLPEYPVFDELKVINSNIQWTERLRRSYRQNTIMSLGGLTGSVEIINLSPEVYGIIIAGERLHCGKQTTFGNGKYVVRG